MKLLGGKTTLLAWLTAICIVITIGLLGISRQPPSARQMPEKEEEREEMLRPADHFGDLRAYPDAAMDLQAYTAALEAATQDARAKTTTSGFTNVPWRLEGPTNIGGRINAIAIDPNNASTMLVGCAVGGIFKTTDAGNTWTPVFDAQPFLAIGDITYAPGSSTVVYAGTGDPNVSGYPFIGNGVYKSTDGGTTWTHLGLADTRVVSRIVVDPSNPQKVYVATMGLPMQRNNSRGVYVSDNGGQTWTQSLFVSNQTGIIDLVMDPVFRNVLYATSWDRIRNNQESLTAGTNAKIWKTTNGGATWTALTGGLPTWTQSRINLTQHPSNSNILYAAYVDSTLELANIYKTTNAGTSWAPIDISTLDPSALGGFGWYFGNVFVNPFQPSQLYLLGIQLWRTSNDGLSWEVVDPQWWSYDVHADKHDMVFTGANSFYLATDGGLYKTTDNGASWTDEDELPNSMIYRVAVDPHHPETYTGGLQDNGTTSGNYLNPSGWPRIYGGDGFQAIYDADPNHIVVETQNGYLNYSDDGGNIFTNFDIGHDYNDRRNWDMPVIKSAHNDNVYYSGTYRIYTNNSGLAFNSWFPISGDLTDGLVLEPRFHNITTIAESPISPQVLYVGTSDGNVHRSTNMGSTWVNVSTGLPDRYVTSIKASPHDIGEVMVTFSGYRDNEFIPHVMRSTNQGNTWVDVSGDLPQLALNDVLLHPTDDSLWVVASDGGVYATQNRGQNWLRVGTGMPMCPVYDMEWDMAGSRLVAGTHARSIMSFPTDSLTTPIFTGRPAPQAAIDFTLFPNPAHGQTLLRGQQIVGEWSLSDSHGRVRDSGKFSGDTAISLAHLAAGIYFVQVTAQGQQISKRLVVQ